MFCKYCSTTISNNEPVDRRYRHVSGRSVSSVTHGVTLVMHVNFVRIPNNVLTYSELEITPRTEFSELIDAKIREISPGSEYSRMLQISDRKLCRKPDRFHRSVVSSLECFTMLSNQKGLR